MGIVLVQEECRVRPKLGREGGKWMVEGEKGAFWVECGQPLITSAGQIRRDSGTGPSDSQLSVVVVVGGAGEERDVKLLRK